MNKGQSYISQELWNRLDEYINQYYRNQALKGAVYCLFILLITFIGIVGLEYFARLNTPIRGFLLWGFVLFALVLLIWKALIPVLKRFHFLPRITFEDAARKIGSHFPEIDDKLLNTVQLNQQGDANSLVIASVEQRISQLKSFDFSQVINYDEVKKYAFRFFSAVAFIVLLSYFNSEILKQGTERVVQYQKHFEEPAPFDFILQTKQLNVEEGQDLLLELNIEGEEIPSEVYVNREGKRFRMRKLANGKYEYPLYGLKESFQFYFEAGGFSSSSHKINVFPSPQIVDFKINVNYPNYLNRDSEELLGSGDLLVPEGTEIEWLFQASYCDSVWMTAGDERLNASFQEEAFQIQKIAEDNFGYEVGVSNKFKSKDKVFSFQVAVIPDEYPSISIQKDSIKETLITGVISDDYGFSKLQFVVEKQQKKILQKPITIENSLNSQSFLYEVSIDSLKLKQGESVSYYFEVFDNDGFNGAKSTQSNYLVYRVPSQKELEESINQNAENLSKTANKSMQNLKEIRESIDKFQQKLTEKSELTWEDKQELKNILDQQKQLKQSVQQMNEFQEKQKDLNQKLSPEEEQLLEKQNQLKKMMEEMFDDETKKMMEEIERLMDELNKHQLEDMMKEMEISNEDMEKELDRSLELFKQLEIDLKLEQTANKLDELGKKQKELGEKAEDAGKDDLEKIQEEQKEISEEFDKLEKELEELQKKNNELETPKDLEGFEKERSEIKKEMQEAQENMQGGGKPKQSSDKQKNAGEKMQEMAQAMKESLQDSQQAQQMENMEDLRQLLDNLIALSVQQENLKAKLLSTNRNDPKYPKIAQAQASVRDQSVLIEDSLFALSKRVIQLESVVNKEMSQINRDLEISLQAFTENNVPEIAKRQQLVMTGYNNLALILDDVLQQMQQQMQMAMSSSSCSKPGNNNKPSMSNSEMQKQLNQQMKELMEKMSQQGKSGKDGKEGGDGSNGNSNMSKEIARMAAKQSAIRRELQKLQDELEKQNNKSLSESTKKAIEEMEEIEKQLYNKELTPELFKRQQEILTRLLESEKALREQEFDNKRESKEGKNKENSNLDKYKEYKRLKELEKELLKTVPPNLKPFYKRKALEYLNIEK